MHATGAHFVSDRPGQVGELRPVLLGAHHARLRAAQRQVQPAQVEAGRSGGASHGWLHTRACMLQSRRTHIMCHCDGPVQVEDSLKPWHSLCLGGFQLAR